MGYRVRVGKINKKVAEGFRHNTHTILKEHFENRRDNFYYPEQHTELYEMGKHVDFTTVCTERQPFYTQFNVYEEEECEFEIITQNDLKAIINEYCKWNQEYFSGLWEEWIAAIKDIPLEEDVTIPRELAGKLSSHLSSKHHAWEPRWRLCPVKFEPSTDGEMTGSWLIEYAIFNLIHILKTFDWENDYLIYSGW